MSTLKPRTGEKGQAPATVWSSWGPKSPDSASVVLGLKQPVVKLEVECDLTTGEGRKAALAAVLTACEDIERQILSAHVDAALQSLRDGGDLA
ncbi:MAG: hypothetical protein ACOYD1_07920 [Candidatus Nanopelagicales bacterium]